MIAAILVLLATASVATDEVDTFFKEFAAKRDHVQSLEARYTQREMQPEDIVETEGTLRYIKPRRIIFHQKEPENVRLLDERRLYDYEPEIAQVQILDLAEDPQADLFFFGFEQDAEALRESYDVNLLRPDDQDAGSRGLVIRPRPEDAEDALFKEVRIYLRDEDYLPSRVHIIYDEQSQVVLEFSNYVVNKQFDAAETQIALSAGTNIILNEKISETVGPGGKLIPEPQGHVEVMPLKPPDGPER